MDTTQALLDSWDRQCRIVDTVAGRVTDANKFCKPSEDGMPLFEQLAHMHAVRREWLGQLDAAAAEALPSTYRQGWSDPIDDLDALRAALKASGAAARAAVERGIASGNGKAGGYDNPVLYLQHMVWHEGWHVGLIFLALRLNGEEPTDVWEEENVWSEWRTEEW